MDAIEILCAGDLHGEWDSVDRDFVESGRQDLVVFAGDLGHDDFGIIETIAALRCDKFVQLGNHDAWDEMLSRPRQTASQAMAILGDAFGGYRARTFAGGRMAIAGCRPFSWGGGTWRPKQLAFYQRHFGVGSDQESAARIVDAAMRTGDVPLILAGHQGPAGLGDGRDAIFGRDFAMPHTDFGDFDFRIALNTLRAKRTVVATIAGHMHEELAGGGNRVRTVIEGGTFHVNTAVVPRHLRSEEGMLRHYVRMRIAGRSVEAEDVWVGDDARVRRTRRL